MDCQTTQQLIDDYSRNRLSEDDGLKIRQHLDDCTDCRVFQQRAARLQRLLALKRYEQPTPRYFENFLAEFHQRLQADSQSRVPFWQRLDDQVAAVIEWVSSNGQRALFAGATASVVAIGVLWMNIQQEEDFPSKVALQSEEKTPTIVAVSEANLLSASAPLTLEDVFPELAAARPVVETEPMSAGPVMLTSTVASSVPDTSRYVLDRISIMPASYEVAGISF